jgi:hypothetical protein
VENNRLRIRISAGLAGVVAEGVEDVVSDSGGAKAEARTLRRRGVET